MRSTVSRSVLRFNRINLTLLKLTPILEIRCSWPLFLANLHRACIHAKGWQVLSSYYNSTMHMHSFTIGSIHQEFKTNHWGVYLHENKKRTIYGIYPLTLVKTTWLVVQDAPNIPKVDELIDYVIYKYPLDQYKWFTGIISINISPEPTTMLRDGMHFKKFTHQKWFEYHRERGQWPKQRFRATCHIWKRMKETLFDRFNTGGMTLNYLSVIKHPLLLLL